MALVLEHRQQGLADVQVVFDHQELHGFSLAVGATVDRALMPLNLQVIFSAAS
jgi:hypothetical protein